jgi:hypothetical protein
MVLLQSIVLSSCYVTSSRRVPPEVATRCPDFSGAYYFPGGRDAAGTCSVLDSPLRGGALRWPHPDGGFAEVFVPAILVVAQEDCSALRFRVLHVAAGRAIVRTSERNLVRRYRRTVVDWGEDSLTYGDRIEPKPSFTLAPVNAAREEISLRKEPSGSLTYKATYWEWTEGSRVLSDCTFPPASSSDWKSVGVESLMKEFAPAGPSTQETPDAPSP